MKAKPIVMLAFAGALVAGYFFIARKASAATVGGDAAGADKSWLDSLLESFGLSGASSGAGGSAGAQGYAAPAGGAAPAFSEVTHPPATTPGKAKPGKGTAKPAPVVAPVSTAKPSPAPTYRPSVPVSHPPIRLGASTPIKAPVKAPYKAPPPRILPVRQAQGVQAGAFKPKGSPLRALN